LLSSVDIVSPEWWSSLPDYMMLAQALRLHLVEGLGGGVGWLFALADKQMSAAVTSMHDDPARMAGPSRSSPDALACRDRPLR
jgi:hypothetical protein